MFESDNGYSWDVSFDSGDEQVQIDTEGGEVLYLTADDLRAMLEVLV